jgi:ABC-type lipopolysaccharide export system ATPase subunit
LKITRISLETPDPDKYQFWAICLNSRFLSVGGCQQIVQQGDEVLFAFAIFGPNAADRTVNFLRLYGPASAPVGNVTLMVTDGKGAPIQDAQISGSKIPGQEPNPLPKTNVNGKVTIGFAAGTYKLKADKKDKLVSIRSNQHVLVVAGGN